MTILQLPISAISWLIINLENRPTITTTLLGITSYIIGLFIFMVLMQMDYRWLLMGTTAGAIPIVLFHWFVSRYERKSALAQVIAILPAIGFVGLAFAFAQGIVASQICYLDADSRDLVCHFD
jgi:hypothetical protein